MPKTKTLTEAEWIASDNPHVMATAMPDLLTERRARLFACACCRLFLIPMLEDARILEALEIAERYADGKASAEELESANKKARKAQNAQRRKDLLYSYSQVQGASSRWIGGNHLFVSADTLGNAIVAHREPRIDPAKHKNAVAAESGPMADLLRDILGNPFQAAKISDEWKGGEAKNLAELMYEEQSFEHMPRIGDLLEQAGCHDSNVLDHCRKPGQHVRGCWVLDGILDR